MNKELQEIEQELFAINKEKRAIEQKLIAIIMVAISETIKECPVKRLGSGCFVIRCSDLIGNIWNQRGISGLYRRSVYETNSR